MQTLKRVVTGGFLAIVLAGAVVPGQVRLKADTTNPGRWRLLNYYNAYEALTWWESTIVNAGVGVGCGFIGLGVSTVAPWGGFFVGIGCGAAIDG
jgi:hypothetical protein